MEITIKNLTQHAPTKGQEGVSPVDEHALEYLQFEAIPTAEEIECRAYALACRANGYTAAMIGGAPYLMGPLVAALQRADVIPLFAFTERKSVEETQPDGSVKKSSVFVHAGWVHAGWVTR